MATGCSQKMVPEQSRQTSGGPGGRPPPEPFRAAHALRVLTWLVLLGGLLAWNLFVLRHQTEEEVELPYSIFVAQVRDGNVTQVQIVGDRITGSFAKAVQWPAEGPAASPGSKALPAASYAKFATAFPQAVGDPSLLPLL